MKKYLLFGGDHYYPRGGANDCKGDYDSVEECIQAQKENIREKDRYDYDDWAHILDIETGERTAIDIDQLYKEYRESNNERT